MTRISTLHDAALAAKRIQFDDAPVWQTDVGRVTAYLAGCLLAGILAVAAVDRASAGDWAFAGLAGVLAAGAVVAGWIAGPRV